MSFNVLVADDNSVMRAMIIKAMRMSGLDLGAIFQAANGREGLNAVRENGIDLVITNINMPEMNGEEMIDAMKADPAMAAIPTLVVSSDGSATRIKQLQQKAVTFIRKPFTPEIIKDSMQSLTGIGDADES